MLPDPRGRTRNQSSLRELLVLALCFLMGSYGLLLSIPLALLPLCRRPSALAGAAGAPGFTQRVQQRSRALPPAVTSLVP